MKPTPFSVPSDSPSEVRSVIVLGGGSAGMLAAISLKRLLPDLEVELVHSTAIGVIGVGEGTTAIFPEYLFNDLGIPKDEFYREAAPTWKQGIKFEWGPRDHFFYDFEVQYGRHFEGIPKANGYYANGECSDLSSACALMERGKAFNTGPLSKPIIKGQYAFHIENHKLVAYLEKAAEECGVVLTDDTFQSAEREGEMISALHFEKCGRRTADLYIDASGFRAELIGKVLEEPFKSFSDGLFCDRAVVGGWDRKDEPLPAYTTAETMDHGWCWQIEHETFINRGYVYGSDFVSDDEAHAEFRRKNPKTPKEPRLVKFRSGRHERSWVGNVVAIGNSSGFVEPLEATAIAQIVFECRWLKELLAASSRRPSSAEIDFYNHSVGMSWDEIRDFLAFHYKFNTRLDTPFWKHCREHTSLGDYQELYEHYTELGPSLLLEHTLRKRPSFFGLEGFLAMLIGMEVPHGNPHEPTEAELAQWQLARKKIGGRASTGVSVKQALNAIRQPAWQWS